MKGIINKIFKTLGNEFIGSILNTRLGIWDKKKIISNQKILSFIKDKSLFILRSIKKMNAISIKLRFIAKLPKIKLIGKNANKENEIFSILLILE
tara:strand:+ start:1144 stop:1428 length:285 start_codon:yes stop_codon:yes gene_type:complete